MADNIELNLGVGGKIVATDDIGGIQHELVKVEFGTDGNATMVSTGSPLPTTDAAVGVSVASIDLKTPTVGQKAMAASSPVVIASDQSAIPISGAVTTGGLTDAQLRASPVPVSGTFFQATQPVSAAALPLPLGASTAALQTQPGVDIGDVTVNNASGAAAVNIQDGGNSITVDGTVTTTQAAPTTIFNGKTSVTTAGTRVVLAASQAVLSVTIKALSTNTGVIYVGNASVASTNGFQLSAGDTLSMDLANLNTINIDSSVNGEGVTYFSVA